MEFRIIPGMSIWNSMPKKYKKNYFKWQNKEKEKNKPLSFNKKNQQKIDKLWKKELKIEKEKKLKIEKKKELKELNKNNMISWMEY